MPDSTPTHRLHPDQLPKYSQGCDQINLALAWYDYLNVQLSERKEFLPAQAKIDIVLQVANDVNFEGGPLSLDIDEDGGGSVTINPPV